MKEFTKTYPSQKMGTYFFLQIVVTKASQYIIIFIDTHAYATTVLALTD
jgi:hypothetical protein